MSTSPPPWRTSNGYYETQPIHARYRVYPDDFPRAGYPERLNIFWRMTNRGEVGLGMPAELERLQTFEDRLAAAVESDLHTIFSILLTWNGRREFVLHTADVPGFLKRLGTMPHETDDYPIEIQVESDPEWKYDRSVTPPFPRDAEGLATD
jgi:hypothetical protein